MESKIKFYLASCFLISCLIAVNSQLECNTLQGILENSINSKILCSIPNKQGLRRWKVQSSDEGFVDIDPDKFQVEPDGLIIKFAGSKNLLLKIEIENPVTGEEILGLIISVVIYAPPKIKDLNSINDLSDEYAHVSCIASGKPIPQVYFAIESSNGTTRELYDYTLFEDQSTKDMWATLRAKESGTYYCRATNFYGTDIKQIRVQRNVAPTSQPVTNSTDITKPRINALKRIYDDKYNNSLACFATGNPLPEIIWYYGNSRIEEDVSYTDGSNTSVSSYVHRSHYGSGLYTCYAKNIHGVAADFVIVVSKSNHSEPIILVPLKAVVNALESDTIECLAAGNPIPNIFWNMEFERVQDGVTNRMISDNVVSSQLRISPNSTGQYMCVATNDNITAAFGDIQVILGENDTYRASVRVIKQKTDIYRENTLSCIVKGNPRPTITWSKDNEELVAKEEYYDWVRRETTSYLTIENGTGYYACMANNSYGTSTIEMAVLDGSNLTNAQPPKVTLLRSVVDIENNSTTISSVVTGRPRPIIQWALRQTSIQSVEHFNSTTGETISTIQLPENGVGRYVCLASNWVGDDMAVVQVIAGNNFTYSPLTKPVKRIVNLQEENRVGCVVRGNPKPSITWSFGTRSNDIFLDGIEESFDEETLEYTSYLNITNGTGLYICMAENTIGVSTIGIQVISVTNNITDISKPSVKALSSFLVKTDFNDTISCEARGNPLPEIIWYYGNSRIVENFSYSDSNTKVTAYVYTSYNGNGVYTCYAKNIHGVAADFVQVVTESNRTEPVTLVPLKGVVNALESDTIECLATGNPEPNIFWNMEFQRLQEGITTRRLSANVVWSQLRISPNSTGQYRCIATNDNITGNTADIQVVLGENDTYFPSVRAVKPMIDILRDNALSCIVTGKPTPTITWSKDNQELLAAEQYYDWVRQETTSYLAIENGTGYYSCRANNSYGSATYHMTVLEGSDLTDAKPPKIKPERSVVDIEQNITTIVSVVTGRPRPIIQWKRFDTPIQSVEHFNSETGETLSIVQIPENGLGRYEGRATNWVGSDEVLVRVVAGPNFTYSASARPVKQIVNLQEENRVGCVVTGNPKPNITWSFVNDPQDEQRLSIFDGIDESFDNETMEYTSYLIITKGTGYYFCNAQNPSGSSGAGILVISSRSRSDTLVENHRIQILGVNESTVTFKIRTKDGQSYKRDIYYLYTLSNYTENATNNSDTGYLTATYDQQIFTLRGLPKGSLIDLYFADDYKTIQELNMESSPPTKSVLLLPPVPEISLKFATTEYVLLQWRLLPASSQSAVDFYEVTYAKLDKRNGEEFLPPKYATETKIPVQIGSSYKMYRQSTFNYHVIKVRAHNDAGYSGWSSLLLSPY